MTHFSLNPGHVRVDRFKKSGKWYDTCVIDMSMYWDHAVIHDAIREAWNASSPDRPIDTNLWVYIILDPYHKNSHPVSLGIFDQYRELEDLKTKTRIE